VVEIRQLRYFVEVAEELHFSRAALRLHISQPALSAAIQKLEADVGVALLFRTTRTIELTDAGRALYEDARGFLRQVDRMLENARAAAKGEAGMLAVGFTPALRETAAKVLASFAVEHPRVQMLHRQEGTVQLIAAVEAGDLDVAIAIAPPTPGCLESEPLRDTPVTCRMHEDHELAANRAVSLVDLPHYPQALVVSQAPTWNAAVEHLMTQLGLSVDYRSVQDPIGGELPADVFDVGEQALLLQPVETPSAERVIELPCLPAIVCRFVLVYSSGQVSAVTRLFINHARLMRDRHAWLCPNSVPDSAWPLRASSPVHAGL
jgi:DNA-binding transcriptional LysR family regulator